MLIEVKAKVTYIIDNKAKKKLETYILDKEVFAQAEYAIMTLLNIQQEEGTVDSYEIQLFKLASVKEIITQYQGEHSYIASLKDTYTDETGNDKVIKYKILLWANTISEAMHNTREIAQQGYDMQIESLKEVNYQYLPESSGSSESSEIL